ncbi:SRPBCC domain-containing protein [Oerskovia sp. NPDC057915]|uniref:SRPBCC family protein n=1 Tax=Oerskovia sp. NPDC057915 TaxID=3346280 RepID=UPI0036DB29B5
MTGLVATASIHIAARPERVWAELVHPSATWMLGANVETDYQPGSAITFEGQYQGKHFEDHGTVLEVDRPRTLRFTHYSPASGVPDVPENHHEVAITLAPDPKGTRVTIRQDNNDTPEAVEHSEELWRTALASLAGHD